MIKSNMKINCDFCLLPLQHLGALMFSPPNKQGNCKKTHICIDCWKKVSTALDPLKSKN